MDNFKLTSDERQKMSKLTAQVFGSANEQWTDYEVLENYNKALAALILAANRKAME